MKQIKSFEKYQVAKNGDVFGLHGKLRTSSKTKYPSVSLYKNGKRYQKYNHHLVLNTYVGPCPLGKETNHKDGNKHNLDIENLEWITRSENYKHAIATGLKVNIGEKNSQSKLKANEVWLIKQLLNKISVISIAKIFKVNRQTIYSIRKGRTWSHI